MGTKRNIHEQKKCKKTLLLMLILLLLVLIPLCSVATYTWLSISKTPKVSDMEMTVNANPGLELSWQPDTEDGAWSQQLAFIDVLDDETVLTPVTWSDRNGCFYTAKYGTDGRIIDIGEQLFDQSDANGSSGHYVKFTFYGRTEEKVQVSLSPAVSSADGTGSAGTYLIGTPVWQDDTKTHADGGNGAQTAVRVGLKITKLDAELSAAGASTFYVYEPNADSHVDGSTGYIATRSIDGDESLVPNARLITQTTTTWNESYPVEQGVVVRTAGEFDRELTLFELDSTEKVQIDVYIWLEGMDADCVNAVGESAKIFANLQFNAQAHSGSGLVPIE